MDWLNLHTSTLDSPEFVGSSPVERSTWLCLLRFCIGQENAGRIVGGRTWKDRQWQQLARVTLREVSVSCGLWRWEGDDLIVGFYPGEKENEVKTRREVARKNGLRGGRPEKTNTGANVGANVGPHEITHGITQEKPTLVIFAKAEGEGEGEREREREVEEERKGNEELVGSAAPSAPASMSGDLFGGPQQPATPSPPMPPAKPKAPQQTDADWIATLSASHAYAGIDIPREHARAAIWCQTKRKQLTRPRFINWLNRIEKPMGSPTNGARSAEDQARTERILGYQPGL